MRGRRGGGQGERGRGMEGLIYLFIYFGVGGGLGSCSNNSFEEQT